MAKIKLLIVDTMENGTVRLQSQLYVGRDTVDFIMENDVLKMYSNGPKGFNFYETDTPYEIVENVKDMRRQEL